MADIEINQITTTATAINNGSFLVIDQDLGAGTFQTQKVPKSVLTDLVSNENISNADLTLDSNRVIDGDETYSLSFTDLTTAIISGSDEMTIESQLGSGIVVGADVELNTTNTINVVAGDDISINGATGLDLLSTNGHVVINPTSSSKNIYLTTNANGAIIVGNSSNPESDVLTPVDGMVKYSNSLGKFIFRENSVWNSFLSMNNVVVVKSATDFATIDSTKAYFIDGIIDLGSTAISVPSTGINIFGFGFDTSKLISSENSFTMFNSASCGNMTLSNIAVEVTGTSSKVFDALAATGDEAIEIIQVNFNNCTSIGELSGFRQGFETGTGRFGGKPNLILSGSWAGGYRVNSSIVRNVSSAQYALYEAGTSFTMGSRFSSNQNIDLNSDVSFFDFAESNFTEPSSIQLDGVTVTRNGVLNPNDAEITPNISVSNVKSYWKNCLGLPNTSAGGRMDLTTPAATTLSIGVASDILGAFTASNLAHFSTVSGRDLKNESFNPRTFEISISAVVAGTAADRITIRVVRNNGSSDTIVNSQTRDINNLSGSADIGYFNFSETLSIDKDEKVRLQFINNTSSNPTTLLEGSYYRVTEK